MKCAIEGKHIAKKYKTFAMEDMNVVIPKGLATVLIGSNGAGKTTLLKIMSGILLYDEGSLLYDNKEVEVDNPTFKEAMVYVPDFCCFSSFMDIPTICKLMKLGFQAFDQRKFINLCQDFALIKDHDLRSKKIADMSTGSQMKVMLCAMLARNGKYLLLDEPAANLDPVMQDVLQEKMRDYLKDEEHTIIYSTHNVEQVHNVADYAIFMCDGKIIEQGMIEDLCESYRIVRANAKDATFVKQNLLYTQMNEDILEGIGRTEEVLSMNSHIDMTIEKPNLRDLSLFILKMGHHHV